MSIPRRRDINIAAVLLLLLLSLVGGMVYLYYTISLAYNDPWFKNQPPPASETSRAEERTKG